MIQLIELLTASILWLLFATALLEIGRIILRIFRYPFLGALEEGCLAFGLAMGLFGTTLWIIGLLGLLNALVMTVLVITIFVPIIINRASFGAWICTFSKDLVDSVKIDSVSAKVIYLLAFLTFVSVWVAIGSPQLGRDALAYHFYCPKWFIRQENLTPILFSVNSTQPFLAQMLFMSGLFFGSEVFAKLYNLGFLFFLAVSVGVFTRYLSGSRSNGTLAACLILLVPGISSQTPYAYTDIALVFYLFLSVLGVFRYRKEGKPIFLFVATLVAGLAAVTKILAFQTLLGIAALLLWNLFAKKIPVRKKISIVFLCLLFFLLPSVGWYLRSWFITGNPVYPYFHHFFTGQEWLSDIRDQTGIGRGIAALFSGLGLIFVNPWLFGGGDNQIGIVFLICAPLYLKFAWQDGDKKKLLLLLFYLYIFWFYLVQHLRFLFPAVPVLCVLLGLSAEDMIQKKRRMWIALLFLGLFLQAAFILYYNGKLSKYFLFDSKENYLLRTERSFGIESWINQNLPRDAYVLIENEPSQYYMDCRSARADILVGQLKDFKGMKPLDLVREVQASGFTHLLVRRTPEMAQTDLVTDRLLADSQSRQYLELMYQSEFVEDGVVSNFEVYRLVEG